MANVASVGEVTVCEEPWSETAPNILMQADADIKMMT